MTVFQAMILGLVQGLGEFLPISSSAHLILVPWFLHWPESGLDFDLALHLGTLVAVTIYFWKDLLNLAGEGLTKGTRTPTGRLAWAIVVGTIPGALGGFLFEDKVAEYARGNYLLIAFLLAAMGIILYVADRYSPKRRSLRDIKVSDGLWIGLGQMLALVPGFSRSGTTITAGLVLGFEREAAAKASFLMGWPIILGGGLLAVRHMSAASFTPAFFAGIAVSAISGYVVIAFLMDYLKRGTLFVFAAYRVVIAAVTVAVFLYR